MKELIVEGNTKVRLDIYLLEHTEITSRSQVKKMFEEGKVSVNGQKKKSGYIVNDGDKVLYENPEKPAENIVPQEIPIEVVYEDEDVICINKPQGMVVHPGAGNYDMTLVNALKFYTCSLSDIGGEDRLGIVHRIDKNTSGLLLVAKNNNAHIELQRQIQTKECKRYYIALLHGHLKDNSGVINKNLRRSTKNRTLIEVCPEGEGREAVTLYRVIEELNGYSLVEFELRTGRTHQIRVHSKSIGHSVVGDTEYAPEKKNKFQTNGQLLHAYKIKFYQPTTKELITLEVPLPDYFKNILEKLEKE